jgi:hypothetical protein
MTGWTKTWVAWGAATGASFAVIEARALKEPGASLSEHLRTAFGFDDRGPVPELRRSIFYVTWGWFGLHILRKTAGCVSDALPTITPS